MYAGIVIDTNNFMNQAGVRTFEAAAFLRQKRRRCHPGAKAVPGSAWRITRRELRRSRKQRFITDAFAICVCPSEGLESPTVVWRPGGK